MKRRIDHDTSNGLCGTLFEPNSEWRAPSTFPDLRNEPLIALDTETCDPHLLDRGPGFIRGDAKVVGFSIATMERAWYFPFAHLGGGNMGSDPVQWLKDWLPLFRGRILGANLQYDLEALDSLGVQVHGECVDIQIAEALIDEEQPTFKLEAIAQKYLSKGKDETLLNEACAAYGLKDTKGSLWKLPAKYVGPYAEWDAQSCIHVFREQQKILNKEKLEAVFQLEAELLPILWKMRKQGIPVDLDAAQKLSTTLKAEEDRLRFEFRKDWGRDLDEWSGPQIAVLCDEHQIFYPRTSIGNPSFTADYLENADHPLLMDIHEIRQVNKFRQTFVNDWIMRWQVKGRIHPQWKQVARDDGGTRSGRMAASNPNPQQVPASKFRKTGKPSPIGKAIRGCLVSDTGKWWKGDYSQQEPRILVHFAALCKFTGAELAAMAYRDNPNMDFYNFMMEAAGIDRRPAKDMYLGRCYGMGKKKMAQKLNRTVDEAAEILRNFDEKVPFVKEIADFCSEKAQSRGYIRTLLGRRRHFNFWEPTDGWEMRQRGEDARPRRLKEAQEAWPKKCLQRCDTHKGLNALIQGSAADMTKAALVKIYKETKIIPYMAVHDEVNCPIETDEQAAEIKRCATTCVDMCVPIKIDAEVGKSWK